MHCKGPGKMAQQIRALVGLAENLESVPKICMAAQKL